MKTTGKLTVKDIRAAFEKLEHAFYAEMINHADRLLDLCKQEEKGHRGWGPDFADHHTSDTINVTDAAKLFAVKRVAEILNGGKVPDVKDYLHTQKSSFMAAAIALEYKSKIQEEWKGLDVPAIASLDYTEFVKVKRDEPQHA